MSSQRQRDTCMRCGSRMEYLRKSEPARNGHHASVFRCPECEREVLRG